MHYMLTKGLQKLEIIKDIFQVSKRKYSHAKLDFHYDVYYFTCKQHFIGVFCHCGASLLNVIHRRVNIIYAAVPSLRGQGIQNSRIEKQISNCIK